MNLETYLKRIVADEVGISHSQYGDVKVLLVSPDSYRTLIEHLGLQLIYHQINTIQTGVAERAFLPEDAIIKSMQKDGEKIKSLETLTEAKDFDLIGFSFSNPTQIINYFRFMELAGIPILSSDRGDQDPIIIAGGMGVVNPQPYSPFIDLFVMGEGQVTILDIVKTRSKQKDKASFFDMAKSIPGVFIPLYYTPLFNDDGDFIKFENKGGPNHIEPVYFADLDKFRISSVRTSKKQGAVLIDKGCKFKCSFCEYTHNTGEKHVIVSLEKVLKAMDELKEWGVEEIYLYSATSTTHHSIKDILQYAEKIGLKPLIEPSRIDHNFDDEILSFISKYRSQLVLSVDGASPKIRRFIGSKNFPDSLIVDVAERAYNNYGINTFSMYQIINFEKETEEDRDNIARVIEKIKKIGGDIKINVYINPVFPSPNTPYERFQMQDPEVTIERINHIWQQVKDYSDPMSSISPEYDGEKRDGFFGSGSITFRVISPVDQFIEGLTLRGDYRSGRVLYEIYEKGLLNNSGNLQSLRKIKDFLKSIAFNYKRYFEEITLDKQIPWSIVRPTYLVDYLDKRYQLLKNRGD